MHEGGSAADVPVGDLFLTEIETELAVAARHVAEARIIVAQQHDRIARLKALGSSTRDHEYTLGIFIDTLQSLEHHERALHASAAKLPPPPRFSILKWRA